LDTPSAHQIPPVTPPTPTLAAAGVTFYFLPPYSPERNPIETLWRRLKHQDIPERSHPTEAALQAAIEAALAQRARAWAESAHDLSRTA
jgi:transposase